MMDSDEEVPRETHGQALSEEGKLEARRIATEILLSHGSTKSEKEILEEMQIRDKIAYQRAKDREELNEKRKQREVKKLPSNKADWSVDQKVAERLLKQMPKQTFANGGGYEIIRTVLPYYDIDDVIQKLDL